MAYYRRNYCCAVQEMTGLTDTISYRGLSGVVKSVCKNLWLLENSDDGTGQMCPPIKGPAVKEAPAQNFRFLMFSQANTTYGDQFADYIKKHGLGVVTRSVEAKNPNTNRMVTVFLWAIDHDRLWDHWQILQKAEKKEAA